MKAEVLNNLEYIKKLHKSREVESIMELCTQHGIRESDVIGSIAFVGLWLTYDFEERLKLLNQIGLLSKETEESCYNEDYSIIQHVICKELFSQEMYDNYLRRSATNPDTVSPGDIFFSEISFRAIELNKKKIMDEFKSALTHNQLTDVVLIKFMVISSGRFDLLKELMTMVKEQGKAKSIMFFTNKILADFGYKILTHGKKVPVDTKIDQEYTDLADATVNEIISFSEQQHLSMSKEISELKKALREKDEQFEKIMASTREGINNLRNKLKNKRVAFVCNENRKSEYLDVLKAYGANKVDFYNALSTVRADSISNADVVFVTTDYTKHKITYAFKGLNNVSEIGSSILSLETAILELQW